MDYPGEVVDYPAAAGVSRQTLALAFPMCRWRLPVRDDHVHTCTGRRHYRSASGFRASLAAKHPRPRRCQPQDPSRRRRRNHGARRLPHRQERRSLYRWQRFERQPYWRLAPLIRRRFDEKRSHDNKSRRHETRRKNVPNPAKRVRKARWEPSHNRQLREQPVQATRALRISAPSLFLFRSHWGGCGGTGSHGPTHSRT